MAAVATPDRVNYVLALAVDADFYKQTNPGLGLADVDPVLHYGEAGWLEGRDPAPWFSTRDYLARYPDVAAAGANPLVHYLTAGYREGREIVASAQAAAYHAMTEADRRAVAAGIISREERALAAQFFDPQYYLTMYPDVAASRADPLDHFLSHGWREGRDPSNDFSVSDYFELNPDVAASGVHPFLHYVTTGRGEGRLARARLGFRHDVLANLKTFETRLADSTAWAQPMELSPVSELIAAMGKARPHGLHVTFSQDDYSRSVGGSQLCVQRESAEFALLGRNHLHVHPANGWPIVRNGPTQTPMGVLWNGESVGVFTPPAIVEAMKAWEQHGEPRSFAIHNMLGHSSRDVIDIVRAGGMNAGYFWLHDMGSLCVGIHLLRNDVENCGAPPAGSPACSICVYGDWRRAQVREHQLLFDRLELTVASPSAVALETWRAGGSLDAQAEVVAPLAKLVPTARVAAAAEPDGVFRFAFPGTPSIHKGWPIFRDLAARFAHDPRYVFIHLASTPVAGSLAQHHPVTVTAERPLAMRQALEELSIDAAMVWSLCLETFSFVSYEAASAGVAVVTGPDSGNVAVFASQGEYGVVLPDEHQLEAWFESGEILKLARAHRNPKIYDLSFSKLTAELVEAA